MSKVSREKVKHVIRSEISRDDCNEGTAARTRPFSCDEILLARKKKKISGDFNVVLESNNVSGKATEERLFDRLEPQRVRNHNKDYLTSSPDHIEENVFRGISQKERHTTSIKEENYGTRIDKVRNEVKTELKAGFDEEMGNKAKEGTGGKLSHRQTIDGGSARTDSKKEVEMNHLRYPLNASKDTEITGGKSVRERKRKDRNRDVTHRDINGTKKQEFRRHQNSDYSDRKELHLHYQESRDNGIRCRSRDRDEKDTKPRSISPKKHKHTSFKGNEHGDRASHPHNQESRDKKGRYGSHGHGDRDRKSRSMSPKELRHTSPKGNERVDQASHPHDSRDKIGQYRTQHRGDKDRRSRAISPKEQRHTSSKGNEHGDQFLHRSQYHGENRRRFRSISPKEQRQISSKESEHGDKASDAHYQKSRDKKLRYRSRDRGDKYKRSRSISPKEQKNTSSKENRNEDQALHSLMEDIVGKKHLEVDNSRIASNSSSNHYNRNGGFNSGLGGYSPRKRKTEVGVRTPSPTARSPEKKRAGWDLPPAGTVNSASLTLNLQDTDPTLLLHVPNLPNVAPLNISAVNSYIKLPNTFALKKDSYSTDLVQLTQATQPLRRLYVENLPASATEKEVMEYFNSTLLLSGGDRIGGTRPCISCSINKDKMLAVVEFLTPEVASAALSFDGNSFLSSILNITRPKEFFELATGVQEKSTAAADTICDTVPDSPHKIFIGGIANVLTSKMMMEIASVFGTLKAYQFKVNEDLDEQYAFLEYVDPLITPKACAGLNGMKLGGKVLTAVQAFPNAQISENHINLHFHQIPEHAKPLFEKPTEVLKLKSVFNIEGLSSLSKADLEETLEDVRLECARFGAVRSVNIALQNLDTTVTNPALGNSIIIEANAIINHSEHIDGVTMDKTEVPDDGLEGSSKSDPTSDMEDTVQDKSIDDIQPMDVGSASVGASEEPCKADVVDSDRITAENLKIDPVENVENKERGCNLDQIFEPGCVFIEYRRTEASCSAAHGLHGRLFDDRVISVQYVPLDMYQTRFPK